MRLHSLTVRAIGPFAEEQVVDFDALTSSGLFLLEGPTGVGKTTILDAITFALYGMPGRESDHGRLHSHFAAAAVVPGVVLEFSVRGRRLRISRKPRYERPRRRGGGTTLERTSVLLQRWEEGGWVEVSHDFAEVGEEISARLGLTREQFTQVVLLPQGEFARFLAATDDNRQELLTKLFGTQLYDRITSEIAQRATVARRAADEARRQVEQRLAAACEAGEVGVDVEATWISAAFGDLPVLLAGWQERLVERSGQAAATAEEAAAAEVAASVRARAAQEQLVHVERLHLLQLEQARLAAAADTVGLEKELLAAARRAEPVRPLLAACATAEESVAQMKAALAEIRLDAGDVFRHGWERGEGAEELRAEGASAAARAAALANLVDLECGADDRGARLAGLREQSARVLAHQQSCAAQIAGLPAQFDELSGAQQRAAAVAGRKEAVAARLVQAREQLAAAVRSEHLRELVAAAEGELTQAVAEHQAAVDKHQELVEARLSGISAELAAQLIPGEACPVCGATEHPGRLELARANVRPISAQQLNKAARTRDEALARRTAAQEEVAVLRSQQLLNDQQAEGRSVAAAELAVTAAESDVAQCREAEQSTIALSAQAATLRRRQEELMATAAELSRAAVEIAAEVSAVEREHELAAAEVAAARGDWPTVAAAREHLLRIAELAEARAERVANVGRALREAAQAARSAELEALRAGFTDAAAAAAAIRSDAERAAMADRIAAHQESVARLAGQLEAAELTHLLTTDLSEARRAAQVALQAQRNAAETALQGSSASLEARRRAARFSCCADQVRRALTEYDTRRTLDEPLLALEQMVKGQDPRRRMTLTAYVLRYWFGQVVQAANTRLESISSGRYELVRPDESANGRAHVGLGLAVLDHHTGRVRSARSLSGGESFYTSLALALGLADVVSSQAGGATLDTLFIDEGFGSLDADTLDEVMGIIDDLRGNGRTVGVVSHVGELKERIPERLEVRRVRPDGPSVAKVVA